MASLSITEVINDAKRNGGGTYFIDFIDHGTPYFLSATHFTGYMVGLGASIDNIPEAGLTEELVEAFTFQRVSEHYLGLWRDGNGNWSLDVSQHIHSVNLAFEKAQETSQVAIYDLTNKQALLV